MAEQYLEQSIFLQAIGFTAPADRAAYLDEACRGNPGLRAELDALLAAHDRLRGAPPPEIHPAATQAVTPETEAAGSAIGPYKLIEPIGEGGMGTVWMAQQTEPVKRLVAVKVIKAGMDSRQVIARFEAERQALALMDHPNISKVLDGGTTTGGRPYFVMDLVKGVAITRYCDEHRLTPRQRLELFIPICEAIQHAHQKGVIHRDLKPSNVLVALYDGKPVPKVIDFGVAKAAGQSLTEKTLVTGFGNIVGTLEYMSPEQAEINQLDIDTRSDIYSLGVLLYELLTGSPPFSRKELQKAGMMEMLRVIREQEPSKPSTKLSSSDGLPTLAANRGTEPAKLTKLVRGDLDWIVMKALEKDRDRRYETANGFAMDVQRYLADEPVLACPPSMSYRLRKFMRRNKGSVLAVSLLLLALMGGIVGTTLGLFEASRQRDTALVAAIAEKRAKETAETKEAETRAVLEFVEAKVFAAGRPQGQQGGLGRKATLRQAADAALPFVEKTFADQPLIEARLRMTLGLSFWYLGEAGKAAKQLQKARMIRSEHLGPDHPETLASMNHLANSYETLGRYADALKLREETLALRKLKLGPDHPDTLMSMNNLALSYRDLGRHPEALKLHEQTLALRKAKLGREHADTFMSMHNLANTYSDLSREADAFKLREEIAALIRTKLGPDHPDTLRTMMTLANSYRALGRHAESLKLHQETLARQQIVLGPTHPETLMSMNNVAACYAALGRHADALKLRKETLALMKTALDPDHPDTLSSMRYLANYYSALGRHAEASKLHEETLAAEKIALGADHLSTLNSMNDLGLCYAALGRYAEALKLHEETLRLRTVNLGPTHPTVAISLYNIACVHALMIPRSGEAVKQSERAMEWLKKAVAAGFNDTAQLKKDTDLDALRRREDFKKLIAELEAGKEKKK
jgi:serine/threonine protein kinase/tetratricopeptide (TPR) repeat protein